MNTHATDQIVLAHCLPSHGAIEDCEVHPDQVQYFFEGNTEATVDRRSGAVAFRTV